MGLLLSGEAFVQLSEVNYISSSAVLLILLLAVWRAGYVLSELRVRRKTVEPVLPRLRD
jgi:hypothetical protein